MTQLPDLHRLGLSTEQKNGMWSKSESGPECPCCGARPIFVGTLAAFTLGLALGIMVMDLRHDQIESAKPQVVCPATEEPLRCSILEKTGIQHCMVSRGE